jgi:hypothetical protein
MSLHHAEDVGATNKTLQEMRPGRVSSSDRATRRRVCISTGSTKNSAREQRWGPRSRYRSVEGWVAYLAEQGLAHVEQVSRTPEKRDRTAAAFDKAQ